MNGGKDWYLSKGIWGGIAATIGGIGMMMGIDIDAVSLGEALTTAAATIGGLIAIIGRTVARETIGK